MAATFSWGNQDWGYGDLDAFKSYLSSHGSSYGAWAANHPSAAAILTTVPAPSTGAAGRAGIGVGGATDTDNYDSPSPPGATTSTPGYASPATGDNAAAPDWDSILGEYSLPSDIIANLNQIWATSLNPDGSQNVDLATERGQSYVRGTSWYAATYPGIQQGINAGLFSNEQGYRSYENQVDQIYQQYWGRAATTPELTARISSGQSVSQVSNQFQAGATLGNISDPLKGLFTADELKAYANEQAGIDTGLGQQITQEANLAIGVNNLYQDFYGRGVTRTELDGLTSQGLDPAAVAQQFATQSNINAMDPAISSLFTPQEIQQIALQAAGGTTQNGQSLGALAQLATQLNPLYHQYTGAGVSRDEVNQAYQTGTTVTQVGQQLSGTAWEKANEGDIQQASGSFGTGQLSSTDLQNLGFEEGGYDTPAGQALLTAYNKTQQRLQGAFKGVLAHPSVSGLLSTTQKAPDVAA